MSLNFRYDCYPFGMEMPGRSFSGGDYRYGFQGQESDDEIKGEGNSVNYRFRMHDPRTGRFFAVDPLTKEYPWYSPYSFSGNKVIAWAELEGKEEIFVVREQVDRSEYKLTYIWDVTAEERGENGRIQHYDVRTGTLSLMRTTNLEERNNSYIRTCLSIPLSTGNSGNKETTGPSDKTSGLGLQRTTSDGGLTPYLQTKFGRQVGGEAVLRFDNDVTFRGITAESYGMVAFRGASAAEKNAWTQPSAALTAQLDALASSYLSGDAIDIKIQITTDNPSSMANIVESNTMRQNAIVNYLVGQGVDRSSIQTLPFLYDQPDWDALISSDNTKPKLSTE